MQQPADHGAPPTGRDGQHPADAGAMLVDFLQHRDVHCPRCDYNLRNATHPACPECGEPLRLQVGLEKSIIGAFLATVAPGLGCGVCAIIFAFLIMTHPGAPTAIVVATFLMFVSGAVALIIIALRRRFMRQSRERQRLAAVISGLIHLALVVFLMVAMD